MATEEEAASGEEAAMIDHLMIVTFQTLEVEVAGNLEAEEEVNT